MTKLRKWLVSLTVPSTHIVVPKAPSRGCLSSMAMRDDHSFWMPVPSDEEILAERKKGDIFARQWLTTGEKEVRLSSMQQLYEEAVGLGFYTHKD